MGGQVCDIEKTLGRSDHLPRKIRDTNSSKEFSVPDLTPTACETQNGCQRKQIPCTD